MTKDKRYVIRTDEKELSEWKERAKRQHMTLSAYIRHLFAKEKGA